MPYMPFIIIPTIITRSCYENQTINTYNAYHDMHIIKLDECNKNI